MKYMREGSVLSTNDVEENIFELYKNIQDLRLMVAKLLLQSNKKPADNNEDQVLGF